MTSKKTPLGKLEKVNIRDIWKNEARDFTNWLAEEENLARLSEELGRQIRLIRTEANVGTFSADILAEEENTGAKIIIENQLEKTDHDHLGKLITYGSGFDAKYLIWIFTDIREEHKQAINWLNERLGSDELSIFAVQIEVWKIGDSMPAPTFKIICEPNNWAKNVKLSADNNNLSEYKIAQLGFWENFINYLSMQKTQFKLSKPSPTNQYNIYIGYSDLYIQCRVQFKKNHVDIDIVIGNNIGLYEKLRSQKDKIEKELGHHLQWQDMNEDTKARWITHDMDVNLKDKNEYENVFQWFKENIEKLILVIPKYI